MPSKPLAIGVLLIVLIGAGAATYWYLNSDVSPWARTSTSTGPEETIDFANSTYGISFFYPTSYFMTEKETGTAAKPQHSIILVQDTPDNRAIMNGTARVASEGPTAITIDIYPNSQHQAVRDWVQRDKNWTVATQKATDATVGGKPAITYTWSGLYEGKSYLVASGDYVFVLNVSWLTPTDQIVRDFDALRTSIQF